MLKLAPSPHIDVWTVEIDSVKALLSGTNPFSITFANPYGDNSPFFPPGVSVNGRLQFGFVYPPLTLLLCVPGWLLGGDPRYSTLAAMGGAALLMGYARPGPIGKLISTVFLFTPRTWFVMDRAWTDPFVVLATAGVVFTACRYPKKLFIALGLYFCLKQHMWIGAPASLLLFARPFQWKEVGRVFAKAAAVGAGVTVPFFLWGPGAFINSVLNIREVYRTDCLSLLAHWANTGVGRVTEVVGPGRDGARRGARLLARSGLAGGLRPGGHRDALHALPVQHPRVLQRVVQRSRRSLLRRSSGGARAGRSGAAGGAEGAGHRRAGGRGRRTSGVSATFAAPERAHHRAAISPAAATRTR